MGDMADSFDEQGHLELLDHQRGECEYCCPYCEQEATARKPKNHRPFADCHPRCGLVGIGHPVHDERCKNRRDASQEGR